MIGTRIAALARTTGVAVLAGAAALSLGIGTAQAAPGTPEPSGSEGTLYGDPTTAAPYWRYQSYDDDCVEMSVADVVGEITGDQPLRARHRQIGPIDSQRCSFWTDLHQGRKTPSR